MLDTHPNVWVLEEKPVVGNLVDLLRRRRGGYPDGLSNLTRREIDEARAFYYRERAKEITAGSDEVIVDKLPLNSAHIGALHRIFPGAKFIFAVRHPADAVLSCLMQHFRPNAAMNNFYSIEEGAYCYDVVMTLVKRYVELLPLNIAFVPYEALIDDLEGTVHPVLDFIGAGWHEEVRKYRDHAAHSGRINTPSYRQVSEPLYTRARYRWQKYRDHMDHVLDTLLPWAEWHGYQHYDDGSVAPPSLTIHEPAPVPDGDEYGEAARAAEAQRPQPLASLPSEARSLAITPAGAGLEHEAGSGPMTVEQVREVTLKDGLVRLACRAYGPDGNLAPSGTLHIPAPAAGDVLAQMRRGLQAAGVEAPAANQ